MPRRKRLVRYRENRAVETAFSDFDLNSRDDWEAVIKAAGGLKIHVKVLRARCQYLSVTLNGEFRGQCQELPVTKRGSASESPRPRSQRAARPS